MEGAPCDGSRGAGRPYHSQDGILRIAMISTPFVAVPPRDYGGTELVVHELVEGLLERGHEVTLFATGDSDTRASLRALYDAPQWPPEPYADLDHVSWALSQVAEGDFDIVHAHSPCALALGRLVPSARLVYTLHHAREEPLSRYYRRFPEVEFVAISRDQSRRETGVSSSAVIHHGLDPSRYHLSEPESYVCFVGRFASEKGPHTAIEASLRAGVPIRLAGDVDPTDREFAEAGVLPLLQEPSVTYLGLVGTGQKATLLAGARALLAPIEWDEPFGLILIEAMMSGCPVVAFPRGSAPELIEEGVTGFIASSVEHLADLIRPGGAVDELDRTLTRAHAIQRFHRHRMVADYERLYQAAPARTRRAGKHPITAA
jgi:glycosyltransferase involved in cell wall biosynthesis